MPRLKLAFWLLTSLTLVACNFEEALLVTANTCNKDSDCTNATCDVELHQCVSVAAMPLHVALEISAGARFESTASMFDFATLDIVETEKLDLTMPRLVKIFGSVTNAQGKGSLLGQLTTTRPHRIEGRGEIQSVATLSTGLSEEDGASLDYAVWLEPGFTYRFNVSPTGTSASKLPPLEVTFEVPSNAADFMRFDIRYPTTVSRLRGRLVDVAQRPQNGFQVAAFNKATGKRISSVAQSGADGADAGTFELWTLEGVEDYEVRITPPSDLIGHMAFAVQPANLWPLGQAEMVDVLVPEPPKKTSWNAQVVHTTEAGSLPVAGAVITLETQNAYDEVTGKYGDYTASAVTDANGQFTALLPQGNYQLIITPPGETASQVFVSTATSGTSGAVSVANSAGAETLELASLTTFSGRVLTQDGQIFKDISAQAFAQSTTADTESDDFIQVKYNRSDEAVADIEGEVVLELDQGTYDIVIKTPAQSGFPWLVLPEVTVQDDQPLEALLSLEAPVILHGQLYSHQNVPMELTEIRAYAVIAQGSGTRTVQIGQATSDETGRYVLLFPPALLVGWPNLSQP